MNYIELQADFERIDNYRRGLRRERVFRDRKNPLDYFDEIDFRKRYRLSKQTALDVLDSIRDRLEPVVYRNNAVPPHLQFFATLRYYATNSFQIVIGDLSGISQGELSKIIAKVTPLISQQYGRYIYMPEGDEAKLVMKRFGDIAGFPGVVGAVDGTHIRIQKPSVPDTANYFNTKHFYSLSVMAVCSSDNLLRRVVPQHPGCRHDARIFTESRLRQRFAQRQLEGRLLGDKGYTLLPYLMTPIRNPSTMAEELYNDVHSRTRVPIENTFGIWKARFPVLKYTCRIRKLEGDNDTLQEDV